jgi:hypothetical protein
MPVIAGAGVSSSSLRCACDQGLGSVTTVERPQNPGRFTSALEGWKFLAFVRTSSREDR